MISLSKFYHKYNVKDNIYAIFNSLVMEIIFVDSNLLQKIETYNIPEEDINILCEYGIYITSDEQDIRAHELLLKNFEKRLGLINLVYLIPSNSCNLNCRYCFINNNKDNDDDNHNMRKSTVDIFLEKYSAYLRKYNINESTIMFYGGEPLINWEIVKYTVLKSKDIYPFKFAIVTNGTLLDEEKLLFIKENNISIGISIDGPKYITDKNRMFINDGSSVYDNIIKKIELLKKMSINFDLSVTISEEFLENQDEILEWIANAGIKNVNYNLLHFEENNYDIENYYKRATEFLIKSHSKLFNKNIFDDRLQRKIDTFVNRNFYFSDCASLTENQITIKPNGTVNTCQGCLKTSKGNIGNILNDSFEDIISNTTRKKWRKFATLEREECLKCDSIFICGGGCYLQAEKLYGEASIVDKGFCVHTKEVLGWLINSLYKEIE